MDLARLPILSETRRRAVYVGGCAGLIGFTLALVWTATSSLVLPWYEPERRLWIWSALPPTAVSMDFFARVGLAAGSAVLAGAVGAFIATRRLPSPTVLRALGVWATAATLLGMFLYAWALGTRVIETAR